MKNYFFSIIAFLLLNLLDKQTALAADPALTYHGRLLTAVGIPVTGLVNFKIQIKSPGVEDCLLWEETQSQTLDSGVFVLALNGSSSTRADGGVHSFTDVFSNRQTFNVGAAKCAVGYASFNPGSADTRVLKVSFNDGTFSGWEDAPSQAINYVPKAIDALRVSGVPIESLLRFSESDGTLVNTSPLNNSQYTELLALLAGTSDKYLKSSATEGVTLPVLASQPTLAAGKLWYEGGTIKYYDASSAQVKTLGTSSAAGTVTNIATGAGLTGGPVTATGTISLASGVATPGTYKSVTVDTYGRVTSGTNPTTVVDYGITDAVKNGGQTGAVTIGTSDANAVSLVTNNTSKLTVLSNGNVGIGTTNPSSMLQLSNGHITIDKDYYSPGIQINYASTTSLGGPALKAEQQAGQGGGSFIVNSRGRADTEGGYTVSTTTVNASATTPEWFMGLIPNYGVGGSYKFSVVEKNGSNNPRLTISPGGNVGIGTTSPASKFHFYGSASDQVIFNAGGGTTPANTAAFNFWTTAMGASTIASFRFSDTFAGDRGGFFLKDAASAGNWGSPLLEMVATGCCAANNSEIRAIINSDNASWPALRFTSQTNTNTKVTSSPAFIWNNYDTELMRISADGKIGIGTASPTYNLDIQSTANNVARFQGVNPVIIVNGNSGGARSIQFQDGGTTQARITTSGATPNFYFDADNQHFRPTVGGNSYMTVQAASSGGQLLMKNFTNGVVGASISATTTSYFNGGNVGIGTTSPTSPLHVSTTATSGNIANFVSTGAGGGGCSIAWDGVSCSSDIRLKENVVSADSAILLDSLLKVRPVHFSWKKDEGHENQTGFIAQELEKIFPEFVKTNEDGYKQVNYAHFAAVLTSGIQELFKKLQMHDRMIASVETENADLKAKVMEIKTENAELKSKVMAFETITIELCKKDPTFVFCSKSNSKKAGR